MAVLQGATPAAPHQDKPSEPVSGTQQAEIAAQRNAEGKELMFKNDFPAASMRFRDAVARAPEAKYFFILCISVFSEGKYSEALSACQGALDHQPDAAPRGKIEKTMVMVMVKNEAKKQGVNLNN